MVDIEYIDLKPNFLGALKDYNIDNINSDIIAHMVKINLIEESSFKIDVCNNENNNQSQNVLDFPIAFQEKEYCLSEEFYNEIYRVFDFYIQVIRSGSHQVEIMKIENNLKAYLDNDEKLKYLKRSYSEIFPLDNHVFTFFTTSACDDPYYCWEYYFKAGIDASNKFVFDYLKSDKIFGTKTKSEDEVQMKNIDIVNHVFSDICNVSNKKELGGVIDGWVMCFEVDQQLKWISNKIKYLESLNSKSKPDRIDIQGKTLEDFLTKDFYKKFKKRLVSDLLIDEKFKLRSTGEKGWSDLRAAACIGWLLKENKILINDITQKNLVVVLSNTFGVALIEGTYSACKKVFETNYDGEEVHIENYTFIKSL